MAKYKSEHIEEIANRLRVAREHAKQGGDHAAHFLIGAGCSITAGIPGAMDLVKEIKQTYPTLAARLPPNLQNPYGSHMALLPIRDRSRLIQPHLKNSKINWGTIALAQLIAEGYVERVLTLNFDLVLENACGLLALQPAVYDFGVAPADDPDMIVSPAIVHLHGQSYGLVRLNTDEETREHREKLEPVLLDTLKNAPLVVIGYSGSADGIFQTLMDKFRDKNAIYWAGYGEDLPDHLRGFQRKKFFQYLGSADFDRFMIDLANSLGCWPPPLFSDPLAYLLKALKPIVSDYPAGNAAAKIDLLSDLTDKVKSWRTQEAEDRHRSLRALYMKREYSDVANSYFSLGDQVSAEDKDIAYWSFVEWGDLLSERAELASSGKASELYKDAATKYDEALKINRDGYEALYNWGTMLSDRADNAGGTEAVELYAAARAKYEAALVVSKNDFDTLRALGDVMFEQSELASGDDAAALRDLADKTYGQANRIRPKDTDVLYEWGNLLFKQGKASGDEEQAITAFRRAEAKYREALHLVPMKDEVLVNWGNLLSEWASYTSGSEASAHATKAASLYSAALAIRPDNDELLVNWGNLLSEQAMRAGEPEASRLFARAEEKYRSALAIVPDNADALYNWANLLAEQALRARGGEATRLFALANRKYEEADRKKPDASDILNNWADMLLEQAKRTTEGEASGLFDEAGKKLGRAIEISPDDYVILCSLGELLSEQARRASGQEAARKYTEADEKFAASLQAEPEYSEGLVDWGKSLLERAKRAHGEEATRLFAVAAEKLERAAELDPAASYGLACLAALRGDEEKCRQNLKNAEEYDALPEPDRLRSDSSLDSVRDKPWFQELLTARRG
jgi:SIR2-like domain/Plant specific mitochondrial import receptor subunit TOM20